MPFAPSSRTPRCLARALSLVAVALTLFLCVSFVLMPGVSEANKRVRIDWDNYQPPPPLTKGQVTAGTIERWKKIYTNFLNSLELVTSDNDLSIDVWLKVNSGADGTKWGDAHAIGNRSADVYGGPINSALTGTGVTNLTAMLSMLVNGLGRTLAHEKGHCDGLHHTSNKSDLMCDGGLLYATQRFESDRINIPFVQGSQLNSEFALSTITPRGGLPTGLRFIRGVGSEGWEETSINLYCQLVGPNHTFGWVNVLGDFMGSPVSSLGPGVLTLYAGETMVPAVRNDFTFQVEEATGHGVYHPLNPLPRAAALYPVPPGDYFGIVSVDFPQVGAQVFMDAMAGGNVPHYYGNGMDQVRAGAIPGANLGIVLILSLVLLAYGVIEVRRRAKTA
jgi:hypothetical protein